MAVQLLELAEGFSCYSSSSREARHIYKEIFVEHCYDVPNLPSAPFVIDAGANIGLFSLWMKQKYPSAKILAFEPAPQTFDVLRRNLALHGVLSGGDAVETYRCGLGVEESSSAKKLTYYPNAPGNSTLYPDQKEGLKALVAQRFPEHGAQVIEGWLGAETQVEVEVQRLSHFLAGYGGGVERIDLLKVDVEGAEFDVLAGLDEEHWALVQNVVLEISEIRNQGALERMERLLESKGFAVTHKAAHPDWSEDILIFKARRAGS